MKSPSQIFTKPLRPKLKSLTKTMLPLIYFGMSHYAIADTLYWDGTDTTSGNGSPIGGSGNWNTSTNWTSDASGTTNQAWGDGDNAVFGGTGGTVTLDSAQSVGDITFNSDGYTLTRTNSANALLFANPVNTYTVTNADDTATIRTIVGMFGGVSPNALTKLGDGKLILAGPKNYSGDTTISAGTLETIGFVVAGNIINNSTYIVNVGTNETSYYNYIMSGPGNLVKSGSGGLDLSTSNTFTGSTTVNDGTLLTRNLSALGNNSAVSVNNGTLVVYSQSLIIGSLGGTGGTVDIRSGQTLTTGGDNTSTTYNGVILGTGQLTKQGAGNFILTGNNTYSGITTISAGTLQIGDSSTSGTLGTGNVTNNSALVFNRSDDSGYAGVISGTGAVTKEGAGNFNLTGTNTYTGATIVNAGILSVNGSISSSTTTVNSGGTLGGTGTVGDVFINGGTFAPGNSIGTINVSGNVDFSGGGNYDVEVDAAGNSDKIVATGSVTLTGGVVNVKAAPGTYAYATDYTILTASGGLGGTTFDSVNANLAFLTPTLSYDANNVFLKLTRNSTNFSDVASTRNQQAVAKAVDSNINDLNSLVSQITPLSSLAARQAFDSLSGVQHSNNQLITRSVTSQFNQLLLNHGSQSASGSLAFNAQSPNATGYNSGSASQLVEARGWWTQGFGSFNKIDDTNNARGADYQTTGLAMGFDVDWNELVIGVAGNYARTDVDPYSGNSSIDSYQAATYGSWQQDQIYVNASFGLGLHKVDASRTVIMGSSISTAKADYDSFDINSTIETGKDFSLGADTTLTPFAGVSYLYNTRESFTEKGAGSANLKVDKENDESLLTSIGLRVSHNIQMKNSRVLTPVASIAYLHEHMNSVTEVDARFNGVPSSSFVVEGPDLDRDRLQLGLGISGELTSSTRLVLGYYGEFAESHQNNALSARLDIAF
jgi:fibronectin-binding autotransporter adhesin